MAFDSDCDEKRKPEVSPQSGRRPFLECPSLLQTACIYSPGWHNLRLIRTMVQRRAARPHDLPPWIESSGSESSPTNDPENRAAGGWKFRPACFAWCRFFRHVRS